MTLRKKIASISITCFLICLAIYFSHLSKIDSSDYVNLAISFYLFTLGCLVFFKLPNYPSTIEFIVLTNWIGMTVLLLYSGTIFNKLGLICLALCPIVLYLFVFSFVQSIDINLKKKSLSILWMVSLLAAFSFIFNIFPLFSLAILLITAIALALYTLKKERHLIVETFHYKMLIIGLISSFFPFSLYCVFLQLFPQIHLSFAYDALAFVCVFPTCITITFIQDRLIAITKPIITAIISLFFGLIFFIFIESLGFPLKLTLLLLVAFFLFCYLSHLTIIALDAYNIEVAVKKEKTLFNERIDFIGEMTYVRFARTIDSLLLANLKKYTQSDTILLIKEENNQLFEESSSDHKLFQSLKKMKPQLYDNEQTITIHDTSYQKISFQIEKVTRWIIFTQEPSTLSREEILSLATNYYQLLQELKELYRTQKQFRTTPLTTDQRMQIKLFSAHERDRQNFANYLHDNLLQSVIAVQNMLLELNLDEEAVTPLHLEFSKLIFSIREEIFNITPVTLFNLSLEENAQLLVLHCKRKFPNTSFSFTITISEELPDYLIAPILRIAKELNENVGKHAHATMAQTTLWVEGFYVYLTVTDNGIGLDDETISAAEQGECEHFGLLSVKNDVSWLKGYFRSKKIEKPKSGTMITIQLPLEKGDYYESLTHR